jgi:hypothetical protein
MQPYRQCSRLRHDAAGRDVTFSDPLIHHDNVRWLACLHAVGSGIKVKGCVVNRVAVRVPAIFECGDDRAGRNVFAVQDAFAGFPAARVPDVSQLLHKCHAVAVLDQCMVFKRIHFLINVRHISSVSKRQLPAGGMGSNYLRSIVVLTSVLGPAFRHF